MLMHDATLRRTTGRAGCIFDYAATHLTQIRADRLPHLRQEFPHATVPKLSQVADLLNLTSETHAFIELKHQSIDHFGVELCMERLVDTLSKAAFQWTLISAYPDALEYASTQYNVPIGWVLRTYSDRVKQRAEALSPQFIFCNIKRLPKIEQPFWEGSWKWVVYDIKDAGAAVDLLNQGADMIESGCVTKLMRTSTFRPLAEMSGPVAPPHRNITT